MELSELAELQSDFDRHHTGKFQWDSIVTKDDDYNMLKFLIIGLASEVGELAGIVKKVIRGDFEFDSVRELFESECADVFIYLLKLCTQTGIDLEAAFLRKLDINRQKFSKFETDITP